MENNHFKSNEVPEKFSHKKNNTNTFWIILLSVLFFLFLVFSKWNKIEEFFGLSTEDSVGTSEFSFGEEVSIEGDLTQDGDFITHTHKLSTLSSGVFGLKSKTINLNQYSGTVIVEGFIEVQHQDLFIVNVTKIISLYNSGNIEQTVETGEIVIDGQYFSQIGLYLNQDFLDKYDFVSTGKSEFKIKSKSSGKVIVIEPFVCKKGDANADCAKLSSTFANSAEKTFTTQYGTVFYKLSEVDSWFFVNKDLFGYFINGVEEQEVSTLSSYLLLPNLDYIKAFIEPKISSICKEGNIVMQDVKKTNLFLNQGVPTVTFGGNWERGTVECTIKLDLSSSVFGSVEKFSYVEATLSGSVVSGNKLTEVTPSLQEKPAQNISDVIQFPLSLDKPLVFTSSRGHSISFPSSKISYSSNSISENLGIAGVNCYVATNIIEYAKKDLIDSEPSVIIYECKIKENIEMPYQYYLKPLSDGRTFVVSVINPAWNDFASNIKVTLTQ